MRCLVCNKELKNGHEICDTCINFLIWKYQDRTLEEVIRSVIHLIKYKGEEYE